MTVFGYDASNHDWPRGPMDLAAAYQAGVRLFTHKVSEGVGFSDPYAGEAFKRAVAAGITVVGGYHVLYPADMASISSQVVYYLSQLRNAYGAWVDHPCFIHQIDAEVFQNMTRAPSVAEINAFASALASSGQIDPAKIVTYAPHWVYGDAVGQLGQKWWASSYGGNPVGALTSVYPGDQSAGWATYGGKTPTILQFGSQVTIGSQPQCDGNAIRVSDQAALLNLFNAGPAPAQPVKEADVFVATTVIDGHNQPIPTDQQPTCIFGAGVHVHAAGAASTGVIKRVADGGQINQAQHDRLAYDLLSADNAAKAELDATKTELDAVQTALMALQTAVGNLASTSSSTGALTQADVDQVTAAVTNVLGQVLGRTTATLAVAPPPTA